MPPATVVYTDGACLGNPGPGGWAWAVPGGRYASGAAARTTNQRMEITAAYEAVRSIDGPLEVVSDSTYVVNCFRDRWWEGWIHRGWTNAKKQPVANRDLWEPFVELVRSRGDVAFRWVKGHSGDPANDLADALAVEAAHRQEGRSGEGQPPDLDVAGLAAQQPGAERGAAGGPSAARRPEGQAGFGPEPPPGHRLLVAGLRPQQLGGFDGGPVADAARRRLGEILAAKAALHPDLVVLSGLSLGAEQLGAEAAVEAGVPLVAVTPFPGFEGKWPAATQERHRRLVAAAAHPLVLERKAPDSTARFQAAMRRRDAWLARAADEAVVVWDHDDEVVGRLVRSLHDHLGEEHVWIVDPAEL